MNLLFLSLCLISTFKCFYSQEEFTFGGASEEESKLPNITFSTGTNETIVKSEMQFLYVNCLVNNYPAGTFSIRWLDSNGGVAGSSSRLYINPLLKSHEGIYNCSVGNDTTPSKKYYKSLDLKVTVPSISVKILQDETLKIGGKVRRECSDLGLLRQTYVGEFTYNWLNQQNRSIGTSNILEIPIVDSSVAGTYICQYKSSNSPKVYEAATIVDLTLATNYTLRIIPNPPTFQYDERFVLRCEVQPSFKDIKYNWYKNNEYISSDQEYVFKKFTKDNVGTYKCVASLMLRSGKMDLEAESMQQITMFRQSKIELTEKPGPRLFVHTGDKKELHCEIETNSKKFGSNAIWHINGKPFTEGSIPNVSRLDRQYVSMLVITNIKADNEGNYECRVGDNYKEVNLVVLNDLGLLETSPPILKVKEGQLVEFHCRAENIPNVKNVDLKWRYESKDGSVKHSIPDERWVLNNPSVAEQTSFIDLTNTRVYDSGYYICTEPNGESSRSELIVIPDNETNFITITPREIRVRSRQRIDIECYTKNNVGRASGQPQFHINDKKPIGRDSRFVVSNVGPAHIRLTVPNGLVLSDDNMNITCASGYLTATARVNVKDVCPPGYRNCQNGQCLENAKFCDKKIDCADGSDENPVLCRECDPISRKCENHNGEIPKKNYFLIHWICDGEDDCGNGYDEVNCGDYSLDNCGGKYTNCSDGKSIPRGFICDENIDCSNGEDENECTSPQVIKTSDTNVPVLRSQQVMMTCEAQGKPLPSIIWRFNWGCITNSSRFSVNFYSTTCNTVSSTLTIKDFQPGDDGIYNCEAISSRQRSFSNDFQVVLQDN